MWSIRNALVLTLCTWSLLTSGARAESTPESHTGVVTITIDDALKSQMTALPIFRAHDIQGTNYVTIGNIDKPVDDPIWSSMTWDDINEWKRAGWELGWHSIRHLDLTSLSDDEIKLELGWTLALIKKMTGVYPTSCASPFGAWDEHVIALMKQVCENHAGIWIDNKLPLGFNPTVDVDPYGIARISYERGMTPENVCALARSAGEKNLWLVLVFHQVLSEIPEGESGRYTITPSALENIASCIADLRDKGIIRVATIEDALKINRTLGN